MIQTTELTEANTAAVSMILGGVMNEEGTFTDHAGATPVRQQSVPASLTASAIWIEKPAKGEGWRPDIKTVPGGYRVEDSYHVTRFIDPMTDQILEHWKPLSDPFAGVMYLLVPEKRPALLDSMFNGRYVAVPIEEVAEAPAKPVVNLANPSGRCLCGCGAEVRSRFAPGHDARLKGWLLGLLKNGGAGKECAPEPIATVHGTGDPAVIATKMGWGFLLDKAGK